MSDIRVATLAELEVALSWAAEEGWNPGLDDAAAFHAADPNGFFVALDPSGAPVASISLVNHTPDFAFLGLYIVRPDFRGQGIGFTLWTHALRHAGSRVVGLDGVEAQQANYRKSGFAPAGSTTRFTGTVIGQDNPNIRPARSTDLATLITMEAEASGVAKPSYMQPWLAHSANRETLVLASGDQIRGFCTVRTCQTGAKIGPLVAQDVQTAQSLILCAAERARGPITLDVPESAGDLATLCEQLGLTAGFQTARMYKGAYTPRAHSLFAVISLELG